MTRSVIDPVSRIGGHLRVEVDVADGRVQDAWSSGTMYRGIERILEGRDPRDAWLLAQRVCGLCGGVHALASVRAVEDAIGLRIPRNARLIRNLMAGTRFVQDHVVQFYHLQALDWVDAAAALKADPATTAALARSLSDGPQTTASYFRAIQAKLTAVAASGQPGLFSNGYWGHPAYELSPEADLLFLSHYLEALDWQRRVMRIDTILGGRSPHPQTYIVGGMVLAPPWGGPAQALPGEHPQQVEKASPIALSSRGLADIATEIVDATGFVNDVFYPDVLALARYYREWAGLGKGLGNYLSYGEFPEDDSDAPALLLPRGRIVDGDISTVLSVEETGIQESVAHSYYTYDDGDPTLKHPSEGQTVPRYAGPPPPVTSLQGSDKYSWLKAPRYEGIPMEVGPLARMLVAYAQGQADVRSRVLTATAQVGIAPEDLPSTLGRIVARGVEARVVVDRLAGWLQQLRDDLAAGDLALADVAAWDPGAWPSETSGRSLGEGPRGAVGHWVTIKDRRVAAYQIVDASTWNGSPRDDRDLRGAWEEALIGTPVAVPDQPVEALRTIHSFDPCTACAVHAYDPAGRGPVEITVAERGAR
jgi:hydrogenase large subunit